MSGLGVVLQDRKVVDGDGICGGLALTCVRIRGARKLPFLSLRHVTSAVIGVLRYKEATSARCWRRTPAHGVDSPSRSRVEMHLIKHSEGRWNRSSVFLFLFCVLYRRS